MAKEIEDFLILEDSIYTERVSKLFDQMKSDKRLAGAFVRNPTNVLVHKVLPSKYAKSLDRKSVNAANDLLFSVLSNEKFSKWLKKYQDELVSEYHETGEIRDKNDVRKDLSKAIIEYGDEDIIINIINAQESMVDLDSIAKESAVFVLTDNTVLVETATTVAQIVVHGADTDIFKDINSEISPVGLRALSHGIIKNANIRKERVLRKASIAKKSIKK